MTSTFAKVAKDCCDREVMAWRACGGKGLPGEPAREMLIEAVEHRFGVEAMPEDHVLQFLGDNAAFGFGLMRLYEVTKKPEYFAKAKALADVMTAELFYDDSGAFFGSSKDPDAVGVFATRRTPFEENVLAIRFFAKVARESKDAKHKVTIARALRAVSDPTEIKGRGRWLGDYLMALEETKGVR